MISAELGALLLADARLPTGAHAHSAGLEPALQAGMTHGDVPGFLEARLRTVGLVEASAAVLARRSAANDPAALLTVEGEMLARMPSEPQRRASGLIGRGLARLAGELWSGHPGVRMLGSGAVMPTRPVALGVVAAALGMQEAQVARASLYDDAQTVAAASLKLLPVDPIDASRWVIENGRVVEELVDQARQVTDPSSMPAVTAPLIEQHSLEHDTRSRRIFVA